MFITSNPNPNFVCTNYPMIVTSSDPATFRIQQDHCYFCCQAHPRYQHTLMEVARGASALYFHIRCFDLEMRIGVLRRV